MRSGPTIVFVSQRLRTKWRRADGGGGRGLGDPRDGKGSLASLLPRRLTSLPGRPGSGTGARTVLPKESPDAVALGQGTNIPLAKAAAAPSP